MVVDDGVSVENVVVCGGVEGAGWMMFRVENVCGGDDEG